MDTSKAHVWLGVNFDEDYESYFELDYDTEDMDDPSYKVCGFCRDIGVKWYDEDWIEVCQEPDLVDLDTLLSDLSVSDDGIENIKARCVEKGIDKVNALFSYIDSSLKIDENKLYNKLVYMGMYNTNLAS